MTESNIKPHISFLGDKFKQKYATWVFMLNGKPVMR